MNPIDYTIPDNAYYLCNQKCFTDALEALVRLDEKVKSSPLLEGWRERLIFDEACACQYAQNELIDVEELVCLDAGARRQKGSIPLASALRHLAMCRNVFNSEPGALLRTGLPGQIEEPVMAPTILSSSEVDDPPVDQTLLQDWRRIWRRAGSEHPLLQAAIAWDAWLTLNPERSGSWRAMLIGALVLEARGLTHGFLVPLDMGRKQTKYIWDPQKDWSTRINAFLSCVAAAAKYGDKKFVELKGAAEILELRLRGHRKNSRLRDMVEFLLRKPVVSMPMMAGDLKMSYRGAAKLLGQLGSTPRIITNRARYQMWRVA